MMDKCVKTLGRIDILVNNAGGSLGTPAKLGEVTEDHWDFIDVNLKGTFRTQAAVKYMKEQKSGKIVNISSVAGRFGDLFSRSHYSAAKAGVLGFTRHVAKEVGRYGININSICPGLIMSARMERRWAEMRKTGKADMADRMLEQIPLGRAGQPEEWPVCGVVCSDEASYITGATIDVNGGTDALAGC
jgi:NAD(P)-dependent dehydrogenase (short-subunit alcohol dehydrogenase family)